MKLLTTLTAFLYILPAVANAEDSVIALLEGKLMQRLQEMDRNLPGVLGVAAIDLQTAKVLQHNGDSVFPQASSIKIPIMAELFRQREIGKLSFATPVTLTSADAVGGSGELQNRLKAGSITVTIGELIEDMIRASDNIATNRLIAIAGMESVNRWSADAGLKQTRLQRKMMDAQAAAEHRENVSTPIEMARLAEMLYHGKAVSPSASSGMIEILKQVRGDFRLTVPVSIPVAAKPGDLTAVRAETGIIFLSGRPFVLSVMSTFLDEGKNPIPVVVQMFYDHFQKLASSNRYGHKLQ